MFEKPEEYQKEVFDFVADIVKGVCEMRNSDKYFLNGLIRQKKPKKILELGVSGGGSSAIILNAIKDIEGAKLHAVDYAETYYKDPSKPAGYILEEQFSELSDKWKLYRGGLVANYLDEIGGEIDFCLIDTMHVNPGELLDFLMVFPYLAKNAVVVLHDTTLFSYDKSVCSTNCILLSALMGQKIIPQCVDDYPYFANIGAVVLDEKAHENIWGVFNLLSLPWEYMPSDDDLQIASKHFERFYKPSLIKLFKDAQKYNQDRLNITCQKTEILSENKVVNVLNLLIYEFLSKTTLGQVKKKFIKKKRNLKARISN